MSSVVRKIVAAVLCAISALPVHSLEFAVHQNDNQTLNAIMAFGEIEAGDVAQLRKFMATLPVKQATAVYLASPGGSLYEGMSLGMYFRENRIKTVVEGGYDCASACALAFLGGTDVQGRPWRSSSSNSRLGFHAFSSQIELGSDQVQAIVADILVYSVAIDAHLNLIIRTLETPSSEIYWLQASSAP